MRSIALVVLAGLCGPTHAQWSPVFNTGCAQSNPVRYNLAGRPLIGAPIMVTADCNSGVDQPFLLAGPPRAQLVAVPPPIVCAAVACTLALRPWLTTTNPTTATINLVIPPDPQLIGTVLRFQGFCLSATPCVEIDRAIDMLVVA